MYGLALALVAALALAAPAVAQEEEAEDTFVYASYFECDAARLDEVDELMKKTAPIYDAAKADGQIANWGWLRHHTGGNWRRLFYAVGSDAGALMDALDALGEKEDKVEGSAAFGEICGNHVDYVWRQASSSAVSAADNPGAWGLSVYYKCNFNNEGYADTLVESSIGPVLDAHVGDGKLLSWSWMQHQIGGEFRRLLALRAADRSELLTTWGEIIEALQGEHEGAMRAFGEICFTHEDYLWTSGN